MTHQSLSITKIFVVALYLGLAPAALLGDEERDASRLINDCGVNSLYLLLRLRSAEVVLSELRRSLPATEAHGLSMAEIQAASNHYGVPLKGRRIGPDDTPLDRPIIALLKLGEDQGHFVVLEPVGNLGKMAMVLDFPRPARVIAYTDLMNGEDWTGLALVPVTPWERFGLWVMVGLGVILVIVGIVSPWSRRKAVTSRFDSTPGQRFESDGGVTYDGP